MKKYISMMAMALALTWGFTACDVETDEEPGGVNIQNMCGYWDISVSQIDENGNVVYAPEDFFGIIDAPFYTYNTASNSTTEMCIDDQGEFWDFKFKVAIDYAAGTFKAADVYYNDDMREIADAIAAGERDVDVRGDEHLHLVRRHVYRRPLWCQVRLCQASRYWCSPHRLHGVNRCYNQIHSGGDAVGHVSRIFFYR